MRGCAIYKWNIKYLLRSICFSLYLKVLVSEDSTRSVGSAFQIGTTRFEKKNLWVLFLARGTVSLNGWPRRLVLGLRVKKLSKLRQVLRLTMLKHRARSAIKRLCSKLCSLKLQVFHCNLKLIRSGICNQLSLVFIVEVSWSCFRRPPKRRAAAFWITWRFPMDLDGSPVNRALQ